MTIGNKIRELRTEKGLLQKELALKVDFAQSQISNWEKGTTEPSANALIKLADFFDVTTDFLLGREDDFGNVTISSGNVSGNNNTVNSHNVIGSRSATLSPADSELLRKYHAAPAELRKAVDKLLS